MKYDQNYMLTHDIDWFCIINGVYVHVASAGGILPEEMNDRDELRQLQHNVSVAQYIFSEDEIEYNENFLDARFVEAKDRAEYIKSFTDMARKGFVSLDRTNWLDPNDNTYHIVCRPSQNIQRAIHMEFNFPQTYQIENNNLAQGVSVEGINLLGMLHENE